MIKIMIKYSLILIHVIFSPAITVTLVHWHIPLPILYITLAYIPLPILYYSGITSLALYYECHR